MATTKLSYQAPPACGDAADLCIPPTDATFTTTAPIGTGLDWSVPVTDTGTLTTVSAPTGVSIALFDGKLRVTRPAVGGTGCAVVHVVNDCGSAAWLINIPAPCTLPCPATAPKITADSTGEATLSVKLPAAATAVTSTTGLAKAAVNVLGDTLTVMGEVSSGAYSITLASPCGPCTINGTVEVEAAAPICEAIRLLSSTGSFTTEIGGTVNVCYTVAGSKTIQLVTYEGLPLGLSVAVTPDGANTKVCITGTVTEDKCTPDAGCRTGKITLKNCAGTFDLVPKLYVGAAPAPQPKFCAGMVSVEEVFTDIPTASRCWLVKASFFPPNTEMRIRTGTGTPQTGNDIEATFLPNVLKIGPDGTGSLKTCAIASFSGCNTVSMWAYHPTCAVISNNAPITGLIALGNECTAAPGAGG
jgi:hypothetical protein